MASVEEVAAMSLEEALETRRSVRAFLDKPVPRETLDKIFAMAQLAPSNCNVQPWRVLLASGATRDRLRDKMVENAMGGVAPNPDYEYTNKFEGDYRKRQIDCAVAMYTKMGIGREDSAGRARAALRNLELFDAPHVAFLGMNSEFGVPVAIDIGIYLQSLMLAMTAHGVTSCAQGSMRNYPDLVREAFPGNENTRILVGISFGYEDPDAPVNETRTTRENYSACVTMVD